MHHHPLHLIHGLPPVPAFAATILIGGVTAVAQLIEDHNVRLPTVAAVAAVVFPGVWWMAAKWSQHEERWQETTLQFQNTNKRMDEMETRLMERLKDLPCQKEPPRPKGGHACEQW